MVSMYYRKVLHEKVIQQPSVKAYEKGMHGCVQRVILGTWNSV